MLQLFIIALNIVKCGLCVDNLNISGNLGNSCMREEFRNIIYKDILLDVNPEGCKDFVRTIFSYIPVTDSIMSIKSDASTLHTLLDHDAALAAVVLRIAFRKLAERNPEIDELALETLLKYFFEFIRNSNDKHAKPCLEFCYEGKDSLIGTPKQVLCTLLHCRGLRNIFEVFLVGVLCDLKKRTASFCLEQPHEKVSVVYAVYMARVVEILLEKIFEIRRLLDGNREDMFENFYVLIPTNNVINKLSNPIISAYAWVDPNAVRE